MKTLRYSTQYKKDFKKYRNDPIKLAKLLEVFRMLENEIELPDGYRAHMLKGEYRGCMECHIEGDFLLIWIDGNIIDVLRIGSHSELFGKKK
ncbi:type II toxin-antitoxin system YafQ family toxin [uncultured Parabacteroides sp.]|uniref:type II toxin-antitoxin system YafQ family toxin n=1 Tax=uncultured Parabacteroides sp. TaxID=512312 RepID=UPI0026184EFA|nr:type II toxin-antitoxin system YafQ family toxin [uncultured Parabacteroides sp.]